MSYRNIAMCYLNLHEYKQAETFFLKALDLNPTGDLWWPIELAQIKIVRNQAETALEILVRVQQEALERQRTGLESSQKAIVFYLQCVAKKILAVDASETEQDLNAVLSEDFTITWRFDILREWLARAPLTAEVKAYIRALTQKVEGKKRMGGEFKEAGKLALIR